VLRFNPDSIVVVLFLNDAERVGTRNYLAQAHFMRAAREESYLLNLSIGTIERAFLSRRMIDHYQEGFASTSDGWQTIRSSLSRARMLAENHGFNLVIALYPVLFRLGDNYPFENIHTQIETYVTSLGLQYVDLFDAFDGEIDTELWVHRVDQHPNEIAHALAGQYLASQLNVTQSSQEDATSEEIPENPTASRGERVST
jgi:hypothetical protein